MWLWHGIWISWLLAILGAWCIGLVKGGLSGINLVPLLLFASILPAKESTGLVLPLLVVGDLCAIRTFFPGVRWEVFGRLLPLTALGVVMGYLLMNRIPADIFRPVIGWVIIGLLVLQIFRSRTGDRFDPFFRGRLFTIGMGLLTGITTMLANAAGPVAALYFLSVNLAKWPLISTGAWLFFVVNLFKLPFSAAQGLINGTSLSLGLVLAPFVVAGFLVGRHLATRFSEKGFQAFLLLFSALAALRLIFA